MKPKILISKFFLNGIPSQDIDENFIVDSLPEGADKRAFLLEHINDYDALLVYGQKVDPQLIDQGSQLKIISNHGVGYDNIDVKYAKSKGIIVANTPNGPTAPTADLAIGLIISVMRRIRQTDQLVRQQSMPWGSEALYGTTVTGKTLGILGLGRIGKALAKRALGFDMKILYHNRNRLPIEVEKEFQAQYATLPEMLAELDILSIHTPLTPNTLHLINAQALATMKPTSFLVNTSRGSVVDQNALIEALKNKTIAGAGLDVFANEPEVPSAFYDLDNVVLTPHIGSATTEDRKAMFEEALGNILQFFKGEPVINQV